MIFLYAHDTVGLGCHRRVTKIASALAQADYDTCVITDAELTDMFPTGEYLQYALPTGNPFPTTERMRLILDLFEHHPPDQFIVDMYPSGYNRELLPTLHFWQGETVLLCRDVLGEKVYRHWQQTGDYDVVMGYYNRIWVMGSPEVYETFAGFPDEFVEKVQYIGYVA